ncbi:MAG: YveK family protein [Aggregatilineales bacterium]
MELMLIWRVVVRRWWLIALPTVVALLVTIPSLKSVVSPPVSYSAAIRFTASPKPSGTGTFQDQSYTPWLASEYAVTNLASWVRTDSFASEVSTQLASQSKTVSAGQVQAAITASDSARSMMTLYLAGADSDELKAIGQACISVLADKTADYWPQTDGQKLYVVPLDSVNVVSAVPPLTTRLSPLVRVGIGLAFGFILAFLVEYLDRGLHNRMEVEALGLPVIAEIPRG